MHIENVTMHPKTKITRAYSSGKQSLCDFWDVSGRDYSHEFSFELFTACFLNNCAADSASESHVCYCCRPAHAPRFFV